MNDNDMARRLSEEEKMLAAGYILGDLTPEETVRLEQLATGNPDLRQAIHALQASFELMPQALTQVEPPTLLGERIAISQPFSNTLDRLRSTSLMLKVLVGLATLAALVLAADNLRLRHQLRLAQQTRTDRIASILQQPNSRLIALTGTSNNAAGTLLFTPGRWQEVIVSLGNLPPLPPEEIYRMWLAMENGDIIYCGAF